MNSTYIQERTYRQAMRTGPDVYELNAIFRMQFLMQHFGKNRFFSAMHGRHYMLELWKYDLLHWVIIGWLMFLVFVEYSKDVFEAIQQFVVEIFQTVFWCLTIPFRIFYRLSRTRQRDIDRNLMEDDDLPQDNGDDSGSE